MVNSLLNSGSLVNNRSFIFDMRLIKKVNVSTYIFLKKKKKQEWAYQSVAVSVNLFLERSTIFGVACGVNFFDLSGLRANLENESKLR